MNQKAQSSPAVDADYMFATVPPGARRPTWKQVMVWVGFGYVATGLFIGGTLAGPAGGAGVSFSMALLAIAIAIAIGMGMGMGILFVLTALLGIIAQRTGLSLALLCRYAYGARGMNAQLINYLGIMAPPLAGPLLADFYIRHKGRYDVRELDRQPAFNRAGVGAALVGMALGLGLELNRWLPEWPNGLVALLATVLVYLLLHPVLNAKVQPLAENAS